MCATRRILLYDFWVRRAVRARGETPGAPKTAAAAARPEQAMSAALVKKGGVASMQLTEKHKEYWSRNLKITSILFVIWFVFTFVTGWFSRELNSITFIGPLGFYMAAQGSLAIYVIIIVFYAKTMNKLDNEYGVQEGEED
jgi:putative solute:sodium symporter small subunit